MTILNVLFRPWTWYNPQPVQVLERAFQELYPEYQAIGFERGRDALLMLFKSILKPGDEVILQAYTCSVVPNAIINASGKPVYADIGEQGFQIDPKDIEQKISPKTKAVLLQHTFGASADIPSIKKIAEERRIFVIEDCAHSLLGSFQGKPLGSFGDAAIFSFGRDKIISGVWGGMLTVRDRALAEQITMIRDRLPFPSRVQIVQALLHPLLFAVAKPLYTIQIGKLIIEIAKKLGLIPALMYPEEKKASLPSFMPERLPGALAEIILHQWRKLSRFHEHRKHLAELYTHALKDKAGLTLPISGPDSESAWLRYTIQLDQAGELLKKARRQDIYLGDWYRSVLGVPVDESLFGYQKGSCPRAERAASRSINLPTHIQISDEQAWQIVQFLRTS